MPTNRKRVRRSRKPSGLTPAEHFFVYGEDIGNINGFELLDLRYPKSEKVKARVEELKKLRG